MSYGYPYPSQYAAGGYDELDGLDAVGYDEIVGYDDSVAIGYDEIVGDEFAELMAAAGAEEAAAAAAPPPAPYGPPQGNPQGARMRALQRLGGRMDIARQVDPRAVALLQRPNDKRREFAIGFEPTPATAAGASASTRARPQILFRPERLIVASQVAPYFTIDNIIVGKDSQMVSADPVPATAFSEVAVGVRLSLKTAVIGNDITIQFTNTDTQDRTFRATIIGTALE